MNLVAPPPLRIGLTGGIGSGKSTVAHLLASHGAKVIDTDVISRNLTRAGGAAMPALRDAFGDGVIRPDGGLDRDQMRRLAFADGTVRSKLEAILHPMISAEAQREAATATEAAVIVFDIPLLVESGHWRDAVHRVLVVDCSESTQVARVVARSGWSADSVKAVMAAQATREQRNSIADDVIVNEAISLTDLARRVEALWRAWQPSPQPAV
jgi:dephospho-CoA kinase